MTSSSTHAPKNFHYKRTQNVIRNNIQKSWNQLPLLPTLNSTLATSTHGTPAIVASRINHLLESPRASLVSSSLVTSSLWTRGTTVGNLPMRPFLTLIDKFQKKKKKRRRFEDASCGCTEHHLQCNLRLRWHVLHSVQHGQRCRENGLQRNVWRPNPQRGRARGPLSKVNKGAHVSTVYCVLPSVDDMPKSRNFVKLSI
jgi:hypothetical protein